MKSIKLILILTLTFISVLISNIFAQSKETKEKLKKIKAEVQKIIVVTDDGETVIEGEDAEKLFDKMTGNEMNLTVVSSDSKDKKNLIFVTEDGGLHNMSDKHKMKFTFEDSNEKGIEKNINVEIKDGEKIVTIKTKDEDGKETVKELKGEEAEKWLEENKTENDMVWVSDNDNFDGDMVFIKKINDNEDGVEKKIDVKIEDGEKKVTIKTTVDGNENVEVLEGEEAEKWLKENEAQKFDMIFVSGDDDCDQKFIVKKHGDMVWTMDDSIHMNIQIEDENGEMKITVTTVDENGDKVEKVYEGEEAEKYLEEHGEKGEHGEKIIIMNSDKTGKKKEKVYKIKIDNEDSPKKVKKIKIRKMNKDEKEEEK